PLGSSRYGNEFGRPTLGGYFRTLSCTKDGVNYGYHKPIMLAGGWGDISHDQALKPDSIPAGYYLVLLGDLALKIGIGGGSRSSAQSQSDAPNNNADDNTAGQGSEQLDFASVQRANPEMERRGVEAIMVAAQLGADNPIAFIHDLGAGGLGNAVAELLKDGKCGGKVVLENIPVGDASMTPAEIWCNESQERFLLAVAPDKLDSFAKICSRENAPYAVIGVTDASDDLQLRAYGASIAAKKLEDELASKREYADIVNLPLDALFPDSQKNITLKQSKKPPNKSAQNKDTGFGELLDLAKIGEYADDVLKLPSVASKQFLITIGDRFVGGLTAREQMAGPWQVPVNDYGATLADFSGFGGEASAVGERTPLAVLNPAASARMALAEVVSNLAASGIEKLTDIKLCANWMAATDNDDEMAKLYEAVRVTSQEMCRHLKLAIPVGKDSLFMSASWQEGDGSQENAKDGANKASNDKNKNQQQVVSPVSLIMSGLAPVADLRLGVDPVLKSDTYKNNALAAGMQVGGDQGAESDKYKNFNGGRESLDNRMVAEDELMDGYPEAKSDTNKNLNINAALWLVTPRQGANRLGGTALAQVMQHWEGATPDIDDPQQVANFFTFVSEAVQRQQILAYHDVSDGGLWACICEMAFASNCGLDINLDELMQVDGQDDYTALFGEEMGAVIQVSPDDEQGLKQAAQKLGLQLYRLGTPIQENRIEVYKNKDGERVSIISPLMTHARAVWSHPSDEIRHIRDAVADDIDKEAELFLPKYAITPAGNGKHNIKPSDIYPHQGIQEHLSESFKSAGPTTAKRVRSIITSKNTGPRPKVAILREQGVNSHIETAWAFHHAGFTAVDLHMNDLRQGRVTNLDDYSGLVFGGGFSYGDVMGAGVGWAANILHNPTMNEIFSKFFQRPDSFSLGICNGCQVMARLQGIIPGADWNCNFLNNNSGVFEARTVMMKVMQSPSIFFKDMQGSIIPIIVAHGEGRASFYDNRNYDVVKKQIAQDQSGILSMIYTDAAGKEDKVGYPLNPNGSASGVASLTSADGRATILMPHPERTLRRVNQCWHGKSNAAGIYDSTDNQETPWQSIFYNARVWLEDQHGK
nr:phosphoribosylformylglycinamidine synthase subunit PurQ [Gammaproteobacteria bacterium]